MTTVIETEKIKDLPSRFFKKSHKLIFSQLRLTPVEHDIFALFLTRLNKTHWESFKAGTTIDAPAYKFNSTVLSDWFNEKPQALYSLLRDPAHRLVGRVIGIEDGENNFQFLSLFKKVEYKKGVLQLIPNEMLMNEFLGVSHGHSQIPHKIFRKLKKEYAKRIYTILCRFQSPNMTLHEMKIDNLHAYLGLLDHNGKLTRKTYSRITELVDRIIKPAIAEIDEIEPNISFSYSKDKKQYGFELIRQGRRIVAIKFLFHWSQINPINSIIIDDHFSKYDLAVQTYSKIQHDDKPAISQEEFNNLSNHLEQLIEKGFIVDSQFMIKMTRLIGSLSVK